MPARETAAIGARSARPARDALVRRRRHDPPARSSWPGAQGGYFPPSWSWSALALAWVIGLWAVVRSPARARAARLRVARCALGVLALDWCLDRMVVRPSPVAPRGSARARLRLGRRSLSPARPTPGGLCARRRDHRGDLARGALRACERGSSPTVSAPTTRSRSTASPARSATGTGSASSACSGSCSRSASCCIHAGPCGSQPRSALVVLLPTLYFTFSRGAWVALGIGAAAAVSRQPRAAADGHRRLRSSCRPPRSRSFVGSRAEGLTHEGALRATAVDNGQRNSRSRFSYSSVSRSIVMLGFLAARATRTARADAQASLRRRPARRDRRRRVVRLRPLRWPAGARLEGIHGVQGATSERWGRPERAPAELLRKRQSRSCGRPLGTTIAGIDSSDPAPAATSASGFASERSALKVRDAHGLYVETLAELGPLGLGLLLVALGVPFVAFWRTTRAPVVAGALGAYAAFVVHAGVDWDWELSAVTLAGLLCGALLVMAARRRRRAGG